jgi:hypothetical protein
MKVKAFSFLLVATLASSLAFGQKLSMDHNEEAGDDDRAGFGIKIGGNMAHGYGTEKINTAAVAGFHAGVMGRFQITDLFGIQPEVLYTRRGIKFDKEGFTFKDELGNVFEPDNDPEVQMDYIDVPILFTFNVLDNIALMVGPQASLMMTIKDEDGKERDKGGFHTFDVGAAVGAEAKLSMFRIGARYTIGFRDVVDQDEMKKLGEQEANVDNLFVQKFDEENFQQGYGQLYIGVMF